MKLVNGYVFPAEEGHMAEWVEKRGGYQLEKQATAYALCNKRDLALDIGAHVGTWAKPMLEVFKKVVCFEPVFHEYLEKNAPGAVIHKVALSDKREWIVFEPGEKSTGDTHVGRRLPHAHHKGVMAERLDSFDYDPDFIKIDCEGFEYFVIMGGEQMIKRAKPMMVVEQKPLHAERYGIYQTKAVDTLVQWGAKVVTEYSGDYFLRW